MMGSGVAVLLGAAAAGYWVLTQAEHQKPRLRRVGQVVGLVIIVVSVIGAACKIYAVVACGGSRGWDHACGMKGSPAMKRSMACPMSVGSAAPAPRAAASDGSDLGGS